MAPTRKPPEGLDPAYVEPGEMDGQDPEEHLRGLIKEGHPYDRAVAKIAMFGWGGAKLTKDEQVALITKTPQVHGARDEAAAFRMGGFKDCYVKALNAVSMERGPTRQQVRDLLRQLRKAHLAGIISL